MMHLIDNYCVYHFLQTAELATLQSELTSAQARIAEMEAAIAVDRKTFEALSKEYDDGLKERSELVSQLSDARSGLSSLANKVKDNLNPHVCERYDWFITVGFWVPYLLFVP